MDILEHTYNQALLQNEEMIEKWKRCISEYICVKDRLETFRNELSLKIMVPLGSKALMRGKLYHTNEILVHLGDGWFAKQSVHQALEICGRRIKNAETMIHEFEQERTWLTNKKDIPKQLDIFSENGRKEIIEDYNEETEMEWRKKHTESVRLYRQQMAEEREIEINNKNDEGYWKRLEELEIQEEFDREFDNLNDQNRELEKNTFPTVANEYNYDILPEFTTFDNTVNFVSEEKESGSIGEITNDWINEHLQEFMNSPNDSNIHSPTNVSKKSSTSNILPVDKVINKNDSVNIKNSTENRTGTISNVTLVERKSNIQENSPLSMKFSYDFIGAFDDNKHNKSATIESHENNAVENKDSCNSHIKISDDDIKNSEKISNIKLPHREENIKENGIIESKFDTDSLEVTLAPNKSIANNKNENIYKEQVSVHDLCGYKGEINDEIKLKYNLLEDYKNQLIKLRNEMAGVTIKSHDELCKQLDNYDLKEELEQKITLLQGELNIENDFLETDSDNSVENLQLGKNNKKILQTQADEDSSEEKKTVAVKSDRSLKKVSFTQKDHTKYLDDDMPDPPLILHFKHSKFSPKIPDTGGRNQVESPSDIYRVFKNCFKQNDMPYKSILKKTVSSDKKNVEVISHMKEPGFGDAMKVQAENNIPFNRAVVIGDVSENKPAVIPECKPKDFTITKGPTSRFKSMRQSLNK